MPLTAEQFDEKVQELRMMLIEQGKNARTLLDLAFDAFLIPDEQKAREAIAADDSIDEIDVQIEQRAVELLNAAAAETVQLSPKSIRAVLTLVKVNNELERAADAGVTIAERAISMSGNPVQFPPTTRVMTNSVLGILRDLIRSYESRDATLARLVLQSQDAVVAFKSEILRQAETRVAAGDMSVDLAFDLHELASQCLLISDHATNIAEQIIYQNTGVIVRHQEGRWVDIQRDMDAGADAEAE